MSPFVCSSSPILLVRYTLVSAKFAMVCLSMLVFLVVPVRFMTSTAQSVVASMSHIGVFLAASSSSSMSSSLILIWSKVHLSLIDICMSGGPSMSGMSLSTISGQLKGFTGWYLAFTLGVWLFPYPSGRSVGEGMTGLDVG